MKNTWCDFRRFGNRWNNINIFHIEYVNVEIHFHCTICHLLIFFIFILSMVSFHWIYEWILLEYASSTRISSIRLKCLSFFFLTENIIMKAVKLYEWCAVWNTLIILVFWDSWAKKNNSLFCIESCEIGWIDLKLCSDFVYIH